MVKPRARRTGYIGFRPVQSDEEAHRLSNLARNAPEVKASRRIEKGLLPRGATCTRCQDLVSRYSKTGLCSACEKAGLR